MVTTAYIIRQHFFKIKLKVYKDFVKIWSHGGTRTQAGAGTVSTQTGQGSGPGLLGVGDVLRIWREFEGAKSWLLHIYIYIRKTLADLDVEF